jgi:hypothetical protein
MLDAGIESRILCSVTWKTTTELESYCRERKLRIHSETASTLSDHPDSHSESDQEFASSCLPKSILKLHLPIRDHPDSHGESVQENRLISSPILKLHLPTATTRTATVNRIRNLLHLAS